MQSTYITKLRAKMHELADKQTDLLIEGLTLLDEKAPEGASDEQKQVMFQTILNNIADMMLDSVSKQHDLMKTQIKNLKPEDFYAR